MARNKKRVAHNYCSECGIDLKEVAYIRPFAKMCWDCKSVGRQGNHEIRNITQKLQERNSKMTDEELGMDEMFEDDPRAVNEKEYGRVYREATVVNGYVNVIERNHDV
tara:strand:+ start:527 stop:850 length:324 start_codon:yes stop_codon:yes gene_type:complete